MYNGLDSLGIFGDNGDRTKAQSSYTMSRQIALKSVLPGGRPSSGPRSDLIVLRGTWLDLSWCIHFQERRLDDFVIERHCSVQKWSALISSSISDTVTHSSLSLASRKV